MTTPPLDPVRALLNARGCPPHIVDSGLPGLVEAWSDVVSMVEGEYELTLDDYLNDLDLRDLIAAALEVADVPARIAVAQELNDADAHFRDFTEDAPCLWGDDIAAEEGLDPAREWWYYRRPIHPGDQLREDLDSWGLG
jgi:hypothetical protein